MRVRSLAQSNAVPSSQHINRISYTNWLISVRSTPVAHHERPPRNRRSVGVPRPLSGRHPRLARPRVAVLDSSRRRGRGPALRNWQKSSAPSRTTMFRVLETLRSRGFAGTCRRPYLPARPRLPVPRDAGHRSALHRLAEPVMAGLRQPAPVRRSTWSAFAAGSSRASPGRLAAHSRPPSLARPSPRTAARSARLCSRRRPAVRDYLLGPEPYQRFTANTITARRRSTPSSGRLAAWIRHRRGRRTRPASTCVATAVPGASDPGPDGLFPVSGLRADRVRQLEPAPASADGSRPTAPP